MHVGSTSALGVAPTVLSGGLGIAQGGIGIAHGGLGIAHGDLGIHGINGISGLSGIDGISALGLGHGYGGLTTLNGGIGLGLGAAYAPAYTSLASPVLSSSAIKVISAPSLGPILSGPIRHGGISLGLIKVSTPHKFGFSKHHW